MVGSAENGERGEGRCVLAGQGGRVGDLRWKGGEIVNFSFGNTQHLKDPKHKRLVDVVSCEGLTYVGSETV